MTVALILGFICCCVCVICCWWQCEKIKENCAKCCSCCKRDSGSAVVHQAPAPSAGSGAPETPAAPGGTETVNDFNKPLENTDIIDGTGDGGPFHFDWWMAYDSDISDDNWRGPFRIRTPGNFGNKLTVTGFVKWFDQGWGANKGRLLYRLSRNNEDVSESTQIVECGHKTEGQDDLDLSAMCEHFQRNDEVHVWFFVGGGGGHQIHVTDITLAVDVTEE